MKICIISKYPPIEGGVSTRTYWIARALGERGHEVHIITNASEVEPEYREELDFKDPEYSPKNVFIHDINSSEIPWHIPFSKAYGERLTNKALEVIEENDLDLIYSYYLIPYGVSGYAAKALTDRPLIIQHAGSDIDRLFNYHDLNKIILKVLKKADRILTYHDTKEFLLSQGISESKLILLPKASVDLDYFNLDVKPYDLTKFTNKEIEGLPILTFIGKIPYHWESKGIGDFANALNGIKKEFRLLFVSNGAGVKEVQSMLEKYNLVDKSIIAGFVPPWRIPSIIKRSTCVVVPEREFPVAGHTSNIPLETKAVGRNLIISDELHENQEYKSLIAGVSTQVINPKDIGQFRKAIEKTMMESDSNEKGSIEGYELLKKHDIFNESITTLEKVFEEICSK